jgi:hypothetical protein
MQSRPQYIAADHSPQMSVPPEHLLGRRMREAPVVTSGDEASQMYVPAVQKQTKVFSGRTPKLSESVVNGCSQFQSKHAQPTPPPKPLQDAFSIWSNVTPSGDNARETTGPAEGVHEISIFEAFPEVHIQRLCLPACCSGWR